jgi:hypothetical protein
MVIKRIGPLSVAKIAAVLYAGIGLLIGVAFALLGMAGLGNRLSEDGSTIPMMGLFFGVGAIVILPICYAIMGFVITLISAGLFNLAAGVTGGVEIDVQ